MLQLERAKNNPILVPDLSSWWEAKAVFNCAVFHDGKAFHICYRAIGEYEDYVSRIGYASSSDGILFTRNKDPVMYPERHYESIGIEDPRLMIIDGETYVTYVVLSPDYVKNNPSVSTALQRSEDFLHYQRHGIMSYPVRKTKTLYYFPDLIQRSVFQRFMLLHRPTDAWVGPWYKTEKDHSMDCRR